MRKFADLCKLWINRRYHTATPKRIRKVYQAAFSSKYLLVTNVGVCMGLSYVGDVIEQRYERYAGEKESKYNFERSVHLTVAGCFTGIATHYWYHLLEYLMPYRTVPIVLKKIVLDQVFVSPIFIGIVFFTVGILEKQKVGAIWDEFIAKGWKLWVAECTGWPVMQFINFYYVARRYRVLFDNLVSLIYDIITSRIKHVS